MSEDTPIKGFKLLVAGESGTGKTSLTKTMEDSLVISHDGKAYPYKVPHGQIKSFSSVEELTEFINDKAAAYQERFKKLPATIIFDSVSRMYDTMYDSCNKRYTGFKIFQELDKEIKAFADFLEDILNSGINIIIISHSLYDNDAGKSNLVGKGKQNCLAA